MIGKKIINIILTIIILQSIFASVSGLNLKTNDPNLKLLEKYFNINREGIDKSYYSANDKSFNSNNDFSKYLTLNPAVKTWKRNFGWGGWDYARYVVQTKDEGYALIGDTESWREDDWEDVYVVKTDEYGDEIWNKTFGEPGSERDWGCSIQQTHDGGFILVGMKGSLFGTWMDLWMIKVDSYGNKEWDHCFLEKDFEWGNHVIQIDDGGYVVIGRRERTIEADSDAWLIRTDELGNTLWMNTFGGHDWDNGYCVIQTNDNGFMITGYTCSFGSGSRDLWLIKTNENGEELWNKTYGGVERDTGASVLQTKDGGYIITGSTESFGAGDLDLWLIKTDEKGNIKLNQTFGGAGYDSGRSIHNTFDGGYILTGVLNGHYRDEDSDMLLIKTDEDGHIQWNKIIGGNKYDDGKSVQTTKDGGYIIAGETWSYSAGSGDVWLVKTDENGEISNPPKNLSIDGEKIGRRGKEYELSLYSEDPENENIFYHINWDDDTVEKHGPYKSGEMVTVKHTWLKQGNFEIKVKARDIHGSEGDWAILKIRMEKTNQFINRKNFRLFIRLNSFY